ncbi:MAG: hypothetical protein JKY59_08085 [Emcibacter sp.]|nr:hypothetical protein [Emcibacter sp.]
MGRDEIQRICCDLADVCHGAKILFRMQSDDAVGIAIKMLVEAVFREFKFISVVHNLIQ